MTIKMARPRNPLTPWIQFVLLTGLDLDMMPTDLFLINLNDSTTSHTIRYTVTICFSNFSQTKTIVGFDNGLGC